jgi:hypothetical protein
MTALQWMTSLFGDSDDVLTNGERRIPSSENQLRWLSTNVSD